ncbi:hypothetical protein CEJ39_22255 [Rhodococcus pyridinivorans]|uniref:hypothetical protein n=1 Tax=Rhodococcus pyridinivorans TaxID=103816 RepID=UPI000DCAAB61|nr:hypothetical protein [Rhodococcus pyridinivorans]AWZ26538.1 hypothetical protein CEJ39_22255 [Rhodococcus pyridinivorans]
MDTLISQLYAYGGDSGQGYATEGDVLVNQTADGVDLNTIWAQAASAMSLYNRERSALAALISYPTTNVGDAIPQQAASANFEEVSEFGEPQGLRSVPDALVLGYDFKDYDLASRMTWKFLRNATAEQVQAAINQALEADNRLVTGKLLRRLFDPTEGTNEHMHRVFGLWNGTDGMAPPPHAGLDFPSTTSHYLASGNTAIDPGDLLDAINAVRLKGFGTSVDTRLIVLCHPNEAEEISTFRAGQEANGVPSKFDFIPSASAPAYLTEENVVGQVAPGEFGGLEVLGSYGPVWIVPSYFVPAGYFAVVATGGPNSARNPIAFRQHTNPAYQGLRIIPGRDQRYPLQDSYFARGFGCGVRYRSAACVVQVTPGSVYTPPVWAWS